MKHDNSRYMVLRGSSLPPTAITMSNRKKQIRVYGIVQVAIDRKLVINMSVSGKHCTANKIHVRIVVASTLTSVASQPQAGYCKSMTDVTWIHVHDCHGKSVF